MVSERRRQLIRDAAARRQAGTVVLDRVRNPHNVAAVLRSCDAFGFSRVVVFPDPDYPFAPDTIGASVSRSANKWLEFESIDDGPGWLREQKATGRPIVVTALGDSPPPECLTEAELLDRDLVVVFGSEKRGVSPDVAALADRRLVVPMLGLTESLNVAACAAIVLFEIHRQRQEAGLERYLLTEPERRALEETWLERSNERLNRKAAAARKRDRFTHGEW